VALKVLSTLRFFRCPGNLGILDGLDDVTGEVTGDVKGDVKVEADGLTIPRLAFEACVGLANEVLGFLPRVGLLSPVELPVTVDSSSSLAFSGVRVPANMEPILIDIGSGACFTLPAMILVVLSVIVRCISGFDLRRAGQQRCHVHPPNLPTSLASPLSSISTHCL
jgi:hypothetical protein